MSEIVKTLITQYRAPEELALYFKNLLKHRMRQGGSVVHEIAGSELFMLSK
jgi:hypothetical protein